MKSVAIDKWDYDHVDSVIKWLRKIYGPSSKETWYEDQDYDFIDLCMSDDIYLMYKLRWQ
jgi:hypothetical protein